LNDHIEKYCIEYIESEFDPQFAILIKGEWGCGKTFFINKLISRYKKTGQKIKSNEIIYVSLFGIGQISEIDDRLFQKMHPVFSSGQFKFATGIFNSLIKEGINISSAGTINIPGVEITPPKKIKSKELEKKLIIIDDIERTSLCPSQIFGYFSEYLYQLNMKLIFIGHEEIISGNDEANNYLKIKEKTIGVEFTIKPEIETAVESFIKELSLGHDKENIKNNCLEAISILNCKNLRTVRQCLYNLKLFYKALSEEIIKKRNSELSKIFINLFIQKSLSIISDKNQIREAIVGFDDHKMNYNDYMTLKKEKNWVFDHYQKKIPLSSIWQDIIFDGDYSKQKISEIYQKEENATKVYKQKNLFVLMSDWRNMNQHKFKTFIDTVNSEFENGVYLHPGEILHYTNIMVFFCECELIEETKLDLINKIKKAVNGFREKVYPINDRGLIESSYAGWAYSDDIEEIKEIRDYIKTISDENLYISLKDIIKKEIKEIKNDVHAFCQKISHINGSGRYYRKPYLYLVNIDEFFHELISLPVDDQSLIIASLEERYGITNSNGSLYDEYKEDKDDLVKLIKLYDASLGDIKYNPPELLKRDISKRLHKLLEYFDKHCSPSNHPIPLSE
jgi:predicted nucleic-acid-binding protein